jgi:hypothetical protein
MFMLGGNLNDGEFVRGH